MKESDADKYLRRHLSGNPPREAFKQQTLHDSTAEFIRVHRRHSARRRAILAAAAILIAGIAFLGGRLSAPSALPGSVDITPRVIAEADGVTVPSDLVAWLDAARLFKRLGMEERMNRAFENAGNLLPYETVAEINMTGQTVTLDSDIEKNFENSNKNSILAEILGPHKSVESISGMIAQSFGDYYYESKTD